MGKLLGGTANIIGEYTPAASLPLPGLTINQDAALPVDGSVGVPAVHVNVPPPALVTLIVCASELLHPALNVRLVVLSCMTGGCGGGVTTKLTVTCGLPQLELKVRVVE